MPKKDKTDSDEIKTGDEILKKNLRTKGITIPIFFAIAAVVICLIFSIPSLGIFPSGTHDDSKTTTAPTQTTEYVEYE